MTKVQIIKSVAGAISAAVILLAFQNCGDLSTTATEADLASLDNTVQDSDTEFDSGESSADTVEEIQDFQTSATFDPNFNNPGYTRELYYHPQRGSLCVRFDKGLRRRQNRIFGSDRKYYYMKWDIHVRPTDGSSNPAYVNTIDGVQRGYNERTRNVINCYSLGSNAFNALKRLNGKEITIDIVTIHDGKRSERVTSSQKIMLNM